MSLLHVGHLKQAPPKDFERRESRNNPGDWPWGECEDTIGGWEIEIAEGKELVLRREQKKRLCT